MHNLKSLKIYWLTAFLIGAASLTMGQNENNVTPTTEAVVDSTQPKPVMQPVRPPVEGVFNAPGGKKMHVYQKHPVPLTPIREADGMWTKTVYQFIDVRERLNQVLYYPTEPKGDRISLLMTMLYATNYDTLLVKTRNTSLSNLYGQEINIETPMSVYSDEYVNVPLSYQELLQSFGYQRKVTINILDGDGVPTGEVKTEKKIEQYTTRELIGYEIKEVWVFDKQRSVIDNSHILAIRPVFEYAKEEDAGGAVPGAGGGDEDEEEGDTEIGKGPWFYFPELRNYTCNADIYNEKNSAECRSFDDVFMKRRFSSVIKGIANEKNDRKFQEYIAYGLDQVLASDQIKDEIRKLEHDLWEF